MEMDLLVALCKRRGFLFQSSEIYGGLNGFWDYGPMGVELKRNVREAWWHDMVTAHNELVVDPGAPSTYEMTGLDSTIIMHPQVWKCSGHYDLFHDYMATVGSARSSLSPAIKSGTCSATAMGEIPRVGLSLGANRRHGDRGRSVAFALGEEEGQEGCPGLALVRQPEVTLSWLAEAVQRGNGGVIAITTLLQHVATDQMAMTGLQTPCPDCGGDLTEPREFNLMFETHTGAIRDEQNKTFLRPETAQGIFVNFKNVVDSTRVRIPFGIAQIGKSFRNEITPRNFTFRSREFEQMEIEFFCHPGTAKDWYTYWRDRRYRWYVALGLAGDRLRLRDHDADELSHYSTGTADIEYAFPFMAKGEFGELEGIAHRGDFDLRSHMEGKLVREGDALVVEKDARRPAAVPRQRQGSLLLRRRDQRAVHSPRDRALGRRRSGDARVPVRGVHRGRGARRKRQADQADADEVPSASGAVQGGRLSRWCARTECPRWPRKSTPP